MTPGERLLTEIDRICRGRVSKPGDSMDVRAEKSTQQFVSRCGHVVRGRASGQRRIQVLLCFAHLSLRELRFLVTVLRLYSHTVIETLVEIVHTAARADLAENHFCDGSVASGVAVLVVAV